MPEPLYPSLPILTPRLCLRGPEPKDSTDITTALEESRPELQRWLNWATPWPSQEETEKWLLQSITDFKNEASHVRFEGFDRQTERFLISLGCTRMNSECFHISYWARTSAAGNGYVTEAVNEAALMADDDASAIALLESVLLTKTVRPDANFILISNIINEIKDSQYESVSAISSRYNLSERRLQELFQTYVGVGLKWILLRYRLLAVTQLAASTKNVNWTDVAVDLGYTDQSHFINDFKRVIGKTPRQYCKSSSLET